MLVEFWQFWFTDFGNLQRKFKVSLCLNAKNENCYINLKLKCNTKTKTKLKTNLKIFDLAEMKTMKMEDKKQNQNCKFAIE